MDINSEKDKDIEPTLNVIKDAAYSLVILFIFIILITTLSLFSRSGEQGFWLVLTIFPNIYALISIYLVIFIYRVVDRRAGKKKIVWHDIGSQKYNSELRAVSKHLKSPLRLDVYAEKYNISEDQIKSSISKGELKGYEYKRMLYIDDKVS